MKLCWKCAKSAWPFLLVLFLAGVSAFLTWLTLTYSQVGWVEQIAGVALSFLVVGGTLLHYVISCMRRHCRHQTSSRQPSPPTAPVKR